MKAITQADNAILIGAAILYTARERHGIAPNVLFDVFCDEIDAVTTLRIPGKAASFRRVARYTKSANARAYASFGRALMTMEAMELEGVFVPKLANRVPFVSEKYEEVVLGRMLATALIPDFIPSSDG
jgi:hypothetical protein